jgi:hypothetical protein
MAAELWNDEGGVYLYHYTEASYAREIAADEHFLVGDGAVFGPGLYATDLAPEDALPGRIRDVCFGGDAAHIAFDGALVLLGDDPLTPFEEVDERVFLLHANEGVGELIAMHSILVGVGQRKIGGRWEIESWP